MTHLMITMGPVIANDEAMLKMLSLGVRLFRFPASKAGFDVLASQADHCKSIARANAIEIQCFIDLPGAKPRLSACSAGFVLYQGVSVRIAFDDVSEDVHADLTAVGMSVTETDVSIGDILLLGDGENALQVTHVSSGHVEALPLMTSTLGKARGVTISGKHAHYQSLSVADRTALKELTESPFDGAMISFCESPDVVRMARNLMSDAKLMVAKIETAQGVTASHVIAASADALLLGRGDLLLDVGVLPFYASCRRVIENGQHTGTPVIVGTQIMSSLSGMWLPNRSELAYVSHLIESGIAGIMLSNETTIGASPYRTVALLIQLIQQYGNLEQRIQAKNSVYALEEPAL